MSRYRLVIEHIPTDKIWYGESKTLDSTELEGLEDFLKSIAKGTRDNDLAYFTLDLSNGSKTYFTSHIIKKCAISIEKLSES